MGVGIQWERNRIMTDRTPIREATHLRLNLLV
jgi:hypothetical protein